MAIITKSIGSAGGRDYSTLQAWEDALPANLVTDGNSQVGECYNDSEFSALNNVVTFGGSTTSSTFNITLKCAAGQSFRDNANVQTNALCYNQANGVGIRSTSGGSPGINCGNYDNLTLDGLQIRNNGSGDKPIHTLGNNGGIGNSSINNCIVEGAITSSTNGLVTGLGYSCRNSVFVNDGNGSGASGLGLRTGDRGFRLVNCTIVRPSDKTAGGSGIYITGTLKTCIVENVAIFGFSNFLTNVDGQVAFTASNNASDQTIPIGTSNQASLTYANQFETVTNATKDFRIKSGADLIDNGITDATNLPAGDDIAKTTRPSGAAWDIGAWEFVTAAAAALTAKANPIFF